MLVDDYVLRQVRKLAELIASIGARAAGSVHQDLERELADAYQSLLGMQPAMADVLTAETLIRMLGDPSSVRVGASLLLAHADLRLVRDDAFGAEERWRKALRMAQHAGDSELTAEIEARLARRV